MFFSPGGVQSARPRWPCRCRPPSPTAASPRPCPRPRRPPRTRSHHWTRSACSSTSAPLALEKFHCPATASAARPSWSGPSWSESRGTWRRWTRPLPPLLSPPHSVRYYWERARVADSRSGSWPTAVTFYGGQPASLEAGRSGRAGVRSGSWQAKKVECIGRRGGSAQEGTGAPLHQPLSAPPGACLAHHHPPLTLEDDPSQMHVVGSY